MSPLHIDVLRNEKQEIVLNINTTDQSLISIGDDEYQKLEIMNREDGSSYLLIDGAQESENLTPEMTKWNQSAVSIIVVEMKDFVVMNVGLGKLTK